jgi:hypothetical protein
VEREGTPGGGKMSVYNGCGAAGPCPPIHRPDSVMRGLVALDSGVAYFPTGIGPIKNSREADLAYHLPSSVVAQFEIR